MGIHEWLELICQVGTLIFAALTYFKDKKISRNHGSRIV